MKYLLCLGKSLICFIYQPILSGFSLAIRVIQIYCLVYRFNGFPYVSFYRLCLLEVTGWILETQISANQGLQWIAETTRPH
jgi:hypothetical protein